MPVTSARAGETAVQGHSRLPGSACRTANAAGALLPARQTNRRRVTTPSPDLSPQPQTELTAHAKVIGDIIAGDPQRHLGARAGLPERPVVVAADQDAEKLAVPGVAAPAPQDHAEGRWT